MGMFRFRPSVMAFSLVLGFVTIMGQPCGAEEIFADNVRIQVDGTPTLFLERASSSSPQVWSIGAGDLAFGIRDEDSGNAPLRIRTGAPTNSLYIDPSGRVALGTGTAIADLHIFSQTINATIRLETPGGGFVPAQKWDMKCNASEFTLGDVTGGRVPFVVESDTPNNLLYLSGLAGGHVGIGTDSPEFIGSTLTGGNARHLNLDAGSGQARQIVQGTLGADCYFVHKGGATNRRIVRSRVASGKYTLSSMTDNLATNIEHAFCFDLATANIGIKTSSPMFPLQVGDAGANDGNGAHVTAGGVWTNASSRAVKQDIEPITSEQARETVRALQPVSYRYKNELDEQYVGFIAEDVPELVATNDRKSLAPMDVVAVLTKVVQDQGCLNEQLQDMVAKQQKRLDEERTRNDHLQEVVNLLSQRLAKLEADCH